MKTSLKKTISTLVLNLRRRSKMKIVMDRCILEDFSAKWRIKIRREKIAEMAKVISQYC